jgi:hypothetical protein
MSVNRGSQHYKGYYKQFFDKKRAKDESLAKVYDIITDLTDRRGLRQEWEQIDSDIQDEIIAKWRDIIEGKKVKSKKKVVLPKLPKTTAEKIVRLRDLKSMR